MKDNDAAVIKVLNDIGYTDEPDLSASQEEQFQRACDPEQQFLYDVEQLFNENILNDLVNSFPDIEQKNSSSIQQPPNQNKPNHVVFHGKKDLPMSSYVRGMEDLKETLQEKFGNSEITVENIANLFALYNIIIVDSIALELDVNDLKQYMEWSRDLVDDWSGKMTTTEFNKLKSDIQQNGIKNYGVLDLRRLSNGDIEVYLGEGNHRMKVALNIGIEKFPVRLYYRK